MEFRIIHSTHCLHKDGDQGTFFLDTTIMICKKACKTVFFLFHSDKMLKAKEKLNSGTFL